jgi:surface protein
MKYFSSFLLLLFVLSCSVEESNTEIVENSIEEIANEQTENSNNENNEANQNNQYPEDAFVLKWEITKAETTNSSIKREFIKLPLYESTSETNTIYDFEVDWGDGTQKGIVTSADDEDAEHGYTQSGLYTIVITGTLEGFNFSINQDESHEYFRDIVQWGNVKLGNDGWYLSTGSSTDVDLDYSITATDSPNLSETTNLKGMFAHIKHNADWNISHWDVSNTTDMSQMFYQTEKFNQPLNDWDVTNVSDMERMFSYAKYFNQPVDKWVVGSVTNMDSMFQFAEYFNQNLDNWDVGNVTNMGSMFYRAYDFNQPLNNWNVSNVTVMSNMFYNTYDFNQALNDWDVSKVTNMESMFDNAKSFNQPIGSWNVENVIYTTNMFKNAPDFNQPLNDWNLSSVKGMNRMFNLAESFNQPLNNWNIENATDLGFMFFSAKNFNQDLSSWDVSGKASCTNFANYSALEAQHYPSNCQ